MVVKAVMGEPGVRTIS